MSAVADKGFRITGWHVLGGITAFFAIVIALDVWFAVLAYRSFSGEVAKDPYTAGLLYNRTLAERQAQERLGWRVEADLSRPNQIVLTWRDQAGDPLDGLSIAATLVRPATEAGRRVAVFRAEGEGRYAADLTGAQGAWDLDAVATSPAGERFQTTYRIPPVSQ